MLVEQNRDREGIGSRRHTSNNDMVLLRVSECDFFWGDR